MRARLRAVAWRVAFLAAALRTRAFFARAALALTRLAASAARASGVRVRRVFFGAVLTLVMAAVRFGIAPGRRVTLWTVRTNMRCWSAS